MRIFFPPHTNAGAPVATPTTDAGVVANTFSRIWDALREYFSNAWQQVGNGAGQGAPANVLKRNWKVLAGLGALTLLGGLAITNRQSIRAAGQALTQRVAQAGQSVWAAIREPITNRHS